MYESYPESAHRSFLKAGRWWVGGDGGYVKLSVRQQSRAPPAYMLPVLHPVLISPPPPHTHSTVVTDRRRHPAVLLGCGAERLGVVGETVQSLDREYKERRGGVAPCFLFHHGLVRLKRNSIPTSNMFWYKQNMKQERK